MNWRHRLEHAFGTKRPDEDVLEELAVHAAAIYAAARAEGCDLRESEARVEEQIQAWTADSVLLRRRRRRRPAVVPPPAQGSGIDTVLQDARYAWRLLRRQPAYAVVLVATMALGIAATTVLGSVTYGV